MPTPTTDQEVSIFVPSGNALTVNSGKGLTVERGVFLTSGDASGYGVFLQGTNTVTVWGASTGAFGMGGTTGGSVITIMAGGLISGTEIGFVAGNGGTLRNHGTISGNDTGIMHSGAGNLTIDNDGVIQANRDSAYFAILLQSSGQNTITNSGTIQSVGDGEAFAIASNGTSVDHLTNTGHIVGAIALGSGADRYDGHLGHHRVGYIAGGDGADTIKGGADNDTMRGDDGADIISGGKGHDILAGNMNSTTDDGDRDTFVFTAVGDSGVTSTTRDTIWGHFTGGTSAGDKIDLHAIDANGSASGNGTFTFIGSHTFHTTSAGEVRVVATANANEYLVSIDTDKDAGAEMTILVHSTNMLAKGDFVL